MEVTPSRKTKLIVFKILEYAEIGGMKPEDCGMVYAAIANCLDESTELEDTMNELNQQIRQILDGEHINFVGEAEDE